MTANIIYLIILILLSGFFSGAEIALFSLSDAKVRNLGSKKLTYLKKNSSKLLVTILIGNNLVNIAAASLATVLAIEAMDSYGAGIATGVMTLLILVFGEIIPKSIAQEHPQGTAKKLVPFLYVLFFILWPFSYLLAQLSKLANNIVGDKHKEEKASEDEVKALVDIGKEEGSVETDEREMIHNIFSLNDITAADVMTVRSDVVAFDIKQDLDEILKIINQTGFSRFPAYQGSLDHIEGTVYVKDILEKLSNGSKQDINIKDLVKPAIFIPEQKQLDDLLREFQKKRMHLGVVVNEHGEITGVVTLEDLIEEIVGEISDETDIDDKTIQRIDKKTIIVDANTEIGYINSFFNVDISEDDHKSIASIILEELGEVPQKNDELTINKIKIIIEEAEEKRIKRVKLIKLF